MKFLARAARHMRLREARAAGNTRAACTTPRVRVASPCVPLKGSALLALGLHGDGVRPMSDIDLLVAPEKAAALAETCSRWATGRVMPPDVTPSSCPRRSALPDTFGEHVDNPFRIELHPAIAETCRSRWSTSRRALWPRDAQPGANTLCE